MRFTLHGRALLVAAFLAALVMATRGITNEGAVSLQGDMARHLMNGAFVYDFVADGGATSIAGLREYAQHYYARYPALSLGHHPPFLPVLLVPFYAVFGVSVFAARLAILVCFLLSAWLLFLIAARLYNQTVGGWAALFFVTSPFVVEFSQAVMSELPMLMCVLLTLHCLLRFRESGRRLDYALFVAAAVMSLTAKQLAVSVFPVYLALLLDRRGRSLLLRRDIFAWTIAGVMLVAPLVVMTLRLSPFNVAVIVDAYINDRNLSSFWNGLSIVLEYHLTLPLALAAGAGIVASLIRHDRRIVLALLWITTVVGSVVFLLGTIEPERYSIAALPAYCLCAASLAAIPRDSIRRFAVMALAGAVVWQGWWVRAIYPAGAEGYEAAARFVLNGQPPATVLFSGSMGNGYFTFFMRKHDALRQSVVLRADKLLTTSLMGNQSASDRIQRPSEIYQRLNTLGTKFVVIEDRPSDSAVLEWLRSELRTGRFTERLRVPIETADRRLDGVFLRVYEYGDASPPDVHATIDIDIPLVGQHVNVSLADLLGTRTSGQQVEAP